MRNPHPFLEPVRPPIGGALFAVRYVDLRGQHVTTLYRRRCSAERLAREVEARGGSAVLWATSLGDWEVTW